MAQHLLLLAEPLLGEGLRRVLASHLEGRGEAISVSTQPADIEGTPTLVLWCVEAGIPAQTLSSTCGQLAASWYPAPLLLVLPAGGCRGLDSEQLLQLPAQGLLEAPSAPALLEAVDTLLSGGRVVELPGRSPAPLPQASAGLGLGQWLLLSGLQQIDQGLQRCQILLSRSPDPSLQRLLLAGQRRELLAARSLLLLLYGPVSLAWGQMPAPSPAQPSPSKGDAAPLPAPAAGAIALRLSQRSAQGCWAAIAAELRTLIAAAPSNRSGQLLALEGLHPQRRSDLLLALLEQLEQVRHQLAASPMQPQQLREHWLSLQPQLRHQALSRMASPYVRLPHEGVLQPVLDTLLDSAELSADDPELPDPQPMLLTLVLGQPLLVEGRLLAPDEPLAVRHLLRLVANWLLRTGEQVAAQTLGSCAVWPELRRYLLVPELLSTRSLERLRNQLNAQQRWSNWLERPVAIYESRRLLLTLEPGGVQRQQLTEPRDQELRTLNWDQQLVTLALESRDAISPQLQGLIRTLGRLLVVLLTEVLGRGIGLIGRGIMQGMGRSLRASP